MTNTFRAFLVAIVLFFFTSQFTAAQTVQFHDDFNRGSIGSSYDVVSGTNFVAPSLNGENFATSDPAKGSVAVVLPAASVIGPNQSARAQLVNLTRDGISSLFLRATLKSDKTDLASGYEVDFGGLWDGSGCWWAIYAIDPVAGIDVLNVTYPTPMALPNGSVVEFRVSGTNLLLIVNGQIAWTGTHTAVTTGAPGIGAWGDMVLDEFFAGDIPTSFHDDFNRSSLGIDYGVPIGTNFAVPLMNGAAFGASDPAKNSFALVLPTSAAIASDQFARAQLVNLTGEGLTSLFARSSLLPDKSDLASGYEVDLGGLWDNSGYWWAIYAIDPVSGFEVLNVTYPSPIAITPGSIVEFRVAGTLLTLLINGQIAWTGTNAAISTGTPGVGAYGDSLLDEFFAGHFAPSLPPVTPEIISVTPGLAPTTAIIKWADVSSETAYYVERCTGTNCTTGFTVVGDNLAADTTTHNDSGLSFGLNYGYRVRAHNDAGYSAYSSIVYLPTSNITSPATPTGLTAIAASNGRSVTLSWSLQDGSQTRVGILRCSGLGCTVSALTSQLSPTTTSYSDDSVEPSTLYRYAVFTANDTSSPSAFSVSDLVQATTPHEPAAPTSLTASVVGGVVVLNWTDNADNETGYIVERCARYGCYGYEALPTTIAANSTSFTDSGTSGGFYSYHVRAINDVGSSAFAEVTSVDTPCGDVVLSPNKVSLVVGDSRSLDAFDASDVLLTGLTWKSNDTNLVSLSTDDPPVLTATAEGTTTIEVTSSSSPSACVATVTVYPGPELPEGTVKWSVPSSGGTPQIIPAVPSSEGVADVFAVSGWSRVQAIKADGHTAWVANTNGGFTIPDFQGGFIDAGDVIQKYDGNTGQALPAYTLQFPWWVFGIHTDGTVFAVDGPNLIGVDPKIGQLKFSIPLHTGTNSYDNDCPDQERHLSSTLDAWWQMEHLNVAGDGYLYLSYGVDNVSDTVHCEEQKDAEGSLVSHLKTSNYHAETQYRLLRVSSDGTNQDILIQNWTADSNFDEHGQKIARFNPDGSTSWSYETHWRSSASGAIPMSWSLDSDPITNADQGVVLTWTDVSATPYSYTKDCPGFGAPCTETSVAGSLTYAPKITTITAGQVSTTVPLSFSGDQRASTYPILQTENGDYFGVQSSDVHKLIKFNAAGETRWTKAVPNGVEPLYALANGGVTYREGVYAGVSPQIVTLDAAGNEVSRVADTGMKQSWTGLSYRPGSAEQIVSTALDLVDSFAASAGGNPSDTDTDVNSKWFPQLEHCTTSPGCIGPYEAFYNALDDLGRRLANPAIKLKAQTEVFDKLGTREDGSKVYTVEAFISYLKDNRPQLFDGVRSKYCIDSLTDGHTCQTIGFFHFLLNGDDVKKQFEDPKLDALTATPSRPLLIFLRPTSVVYASLGMNLGNESLIFHEALHGFTGLYDFGTPTIPKGLLELLVVNGSSNTEICAITITIQNKVLQYSPQLDLTKSEPGQQLCPWREH